LSTVSAWLPIIQAESHAFQAKVMTEMVHKESTLRGVTGKRFA
jgi:hypothetical protein